MSPQVPGPHNDYKSPEKASGDRVRGTKSVFESAIWIAINNEQRVGRGRAPTVTLLHLETRSPARDHWWEEGLNEWVAIEDVRMFDTGIFLSDLWMSC